MLRFYADSFATVTLMLRTSAVRMENATPQNLEERRAKVIGHMDQIRAKIGDLQLTAAVMGQFEHLDYAVKYADKAEIEILLREFTMSLLTDIQRHYFIMIPEGRKEYLEQNTAPFTTLVETVFSAARGDILATSHCMGLEEWTAAVFHLMRVVSMEYAIWQGVS